MKYKTIFHVDDDAEDCQLISEIIATMPDGPNYFKSHDPKHALATLVNKEVEPDVIVLDYYIAAMDAVESCRNSKKQKASMPSRLSFFLQ